MALRKGMQLEDNAYQRITCKIFETYLLMVLTNILAE